MIIVVAGALNSATLSVAAQTPLIVTGSMTVAPPALTVSRFIIKYRSAALQAQGFVESQAGALSTIAGVPLTYERAMSGYAHILSLENSIPLTQSQQIALSITSQNAGLEYVIPDYAVHALLAPSDPLYVNQWHYGSGFGVNATAAWSSVTGSENILVALIDTGILIDHPDLSGRTIGGYDFVSNLKKANDGNGRDPDPSDPGDWISWTDLGFENGCLQFPRQSSWHGTHVAGTIAARSNNALGVAGLNWASRVVPIRALGKCGGDVSDLLDAIRWAAGLPVPGAPANPNPARIINLSLGAPLSCDAAMQSAINDARNAGAIIIAGAGNEGQNQVYSPAACQGVVAVAATNRDGNRARFDAQNQLGSNVGARIDISAPGGETWQAGANGILSTLNTGKQGPETPAYAYYQGTSMATPHVSGVASLVLSANPSLTSEQVVAILKLTVTPFPSDSTCSTQNCGAGIVNAFAAVQEALRRGGNPPGTPQPSSTPIVTPTLTPAPSPTPPIDTSNCLTMTENGGFESNDMSAWRLSAGANVMSGDARNGARAVWLGQSILSTATLRTSKAFLIDANAGSMTISFWLKLTSAELFRDTPDDIFTASLEDAQSGQRILAFSRLSDMDAQDAWQLISYSPSTTDWTTLKGRSVHLVFEMKNDFLFVTKAGLDDVAWQVCTAGKSVPPTTPAPIPPPAAQPTAEIVSERVYLPLLMRD